jgi:hypothetical protein
MWKATLVICHQCESWKATSMLYHQYFQKIVEVERPLLWCVTGVSKRKLEDHFIVISPLFPKESLKATSAISKQFFRKKLQGYFFWLVISVSERKLKGHFCDLYSFFLKERWTNIFQQAITNLFPFPIVDYCKTVYLKSYYIER